jgi:hypothetical protein
MGSHEETTFFLRDIESQLQILRADGPSTSRAPRHGHTTVFFRGVKYCLQPTGISGSGENMKMSICLSCWSLLQQQELPFASLVHIDAGMRPTHLPEMTLLESLIVLPLRPHRFFALAKPHYCKGDSEQFSEALCSHVVAYTNSSSDSLANLFPLNIDDIPEHFLLVLISASDNIESAQAKACKVKAASVRGQVVVMNARYYAQVWNNSPFQVCEANLIAYSKFEGVPKSVVANMIYAKSKEEASIALKAFRGDREGSSMARFGSNVEQDAFSETDGEIDYFEKQTTGSVYMTGIDDLDLQLETSGLYNWTNKDKTEFPGCEALRQGSILAVGTARTAKPFSDYDKKWWLYCHPSTFFFDAGYCPEGMTIRTWIRILLTRYPREQYAQNVKLLLDTFDIICCHEVNTQSYVQLKVNPQSMTTIAKMQCDEVLLVKQLLLQNIQGKRLRSILETAPPAVGTLYHAFYSTSSRIQGSPGW